MFLGSEGSELRRRVEAAEYYRVATCANNQLDWLKQCYAVPMAKPKSLSDKLYRDDAYIAVARTVRYFTLPCSEVVEKLKDALAAHGREKLDEAAKDLLAIEGTHPNATARLKDDVRKLCWGLLGPDGDQWDEFYANVENPPPNPYKPAVPKPLDVAPLPDSGDSPTPDREPKRYAVPPEMTAEEMIHSLSDPQLAELIAECRWAISHYGLKSRKSRPFKKDLHMAEVESTRRHPVSSEEDELDIDEVAAALANTIKIETGMECIVAHPEEIQRLQKLPTRKLNDMLDTDLYEVSRYGPETITHQEAAREAALIETELSRRKVPR